MKKISMLVVIFLLCVNIAFAQDLQTFVTEGLIPGTDKCMQRILNVKKDNKIIFTQEIDQSIGYYSDKNYLVIFTGFGDESSSKPRMFIGNVYKYQNNTMILRCIILTSQKYIIPDCLASPLYKFRKENSPIGRDILSNLYPIITFTERFSDEKLNELMQLLALVKNKDREKAISIMNIIGNRGFVDPEPIYIKLCFILESNSNFIIKKNFGSYEFYYSNDSKYQQNIESVPFCVFSVENGKIVFFEMFKHHSVFYIPPRPTNYSR